MGGQLECLGALAEELLVGGQLGVGNYLVESGPEVGVQFQGIVDFRSPGSEVESYFQGIAKFLD